MNYLEFNDAKGRDARLRAQTHNAERARREVLAAEYAAAPWCITLFMSKYEVRSRCAEARVYNLGVRS